MAPRASPGLTQAGRCQWDAHGHESGRLRVRLGCDKCHVSCVLLLWCNTNDRFRGIMNAWLPRANHYSMASQYFWEYTVTENRQKALQSPCNGYATSLADAPFLPAKSLQDEVEQYNQEKPFDPIFDPSPSNECIRIVILFLKWYHLYRRRYPPKDELDIKELKTLGLLWPLTIHILHIMSDIYINIYTLHRQYT